MHFIKNLCLILMFASSLGVTFIGCGSSESNTFSSAIDDSYKYKGISKIKGSWKIKGIYASNSSLISSFRENKSRSIMFDVLSRNDDFRPNSSFIISDRTFKVGNQTSKIEWVASSNWMHVVDEECSVNYELENPNELILLSSYKQINKFFPYFNYMSNNLKGDNLKDLNSEYYAIVLTKE